MVYEDTQQCPSDIYRQPTIYESFCKDLHTSSLLSFHSEETSKSQESYSQFGDTDCGEPMRAQRLVIDFTPDPEIDTEDSQKKCCEFWDFINGNPDIQHLMAVPDPNLNVEEWSKAKSPFSSTAGESSTEAIAKEKTAVSVLEICEEKELIKRAFEPKFCISHCSEVYRDYVLGDDLKQQRKPKKHGTSVSTPHGPLPEVTSLFKDINEWDKLHPKSMEPPGPTLEPRAILQRLNPPLI